MPLTAVKAKSPLDRRSESAAPLPGGPLMT